MPVPVPAPVLTPGVQDGDRPLTVAAARGYADTVRVLIRWGADYTLKDDVSLSPNGIQACLYACMPVLNRSSCVIIGRDERCRQREGK